MNTITSSDPAIDSDKRDTNSLPIEPFKAENIFFHAEQTRHAMLSDKQKKEINKVLTANTVIANIAALMTHFIEIKNNSQPLTGLTSAQVRKVSSLISKRKKYKEAYLINKHDVSIYNKLIRNERKIVPLNMIVQWWSLNMSALTKASLWKDIASNTENESRKNDEKEKTTRQHLAKLDEIKKFWESHCEFAGTSSSKLLEFYNQNACVMESKIQNELNSKRNYPEILRSYMQHSITQIGNVKKHAIHSMLARLQCVEFYEDIKCDDVLHFICDSINKACNINLTKSGKQPEPRRGLTPQLIQSFCRIIADYCQNNPEEIELRENFNRLKMQSIPIEWRHPDNNQPALQKLCNDPTLIYFANSVPSIMAKASRQNDIGAKILNSDCLDNKSFALEKLKSMFFHAGSHYRRLLGEKNGMPDNFFSQLFLEYQKQFLKLLNKTNQRIGTELNRQLDAILDDALANKEPDYKKIDNIRLQIRRARQFNKIYLHESWFASGDLILILANRLSHMLSTQKTPDAEQCKALHKLFKSFYPLSSSRHVQKLKHIFASLPDIMQMMKYENENLQLHFLMRYLEAPFASKKQVEASLNRHRHITKTFDATLAQTLPEFISNIMKDTSKVVSPAATRKYPSFLNELRESAIKKRLTANDGEFARKDITKYNH